MKVVNATWEKRNIGVFCNEITIEACDNIEIIQKELSKVESEYTVLKIPTGKIDILMQIQKLGYLFIETLTTCSRNLEPFVLSKLQNRIIDQTDCCEMNDDDIAFMFNEINNGLFATDRVALDPYFSIEQANNRYVCWIKDELLRGSKAYKITYGDKNIGFFTLKKTSDIECYAFLGGLFSAFSTSGFGFSTYYHELEKAKLFGVKRLKTSFSSNNRGALAVHLSMGCTLNEQYYVLIKHSTYNQ